MKFIRALSVKATANGVSVTAKAPPRLVPEQTREDALKKLQDSFLFESLNSTDRRRVFRPSRAYRLENSSEPLVKDGVTLTPTEYPGLPSVRDLSTIIETTESPEDVAVARGFLAQYAKYATPRRNLRPQHFAAYLRKAAEIGEFEHAYHNVAVSRDAYESFLTPAVYSEIMRIWALRSPSLSKHSIQKLFKLHTKAEPAVSRETALLYGLAQLQSRFNEKVDDRIQKQLAATIEAANAAEEVAPVDAAIGIAAAELLGEAGKPLAEILQAKGAGDGAENEIYKIVFETRPEPESAESAESAKSTESTA